MARDARTRASADLDFPCRGGGLRRESIQELFKGFPDGGKCCRRLMFNDGGFGDHADPQLRAFVGVWVFERGEVGQAQLRVDVVPIPEFRRLPRSPRALPAAARRRGRATIALVCSDDQTPAPRRHADDGSLHLGGQETIMEFTVQCKQIRGAVAE